MIEKENDWYKKIWTLSIKEMSWVEETEKQVQFILDTLHLDGTEQILDLACGYGRHSLAFARRGFEVTGVDLTKDYIEDAVASSKAEGLQTIFIQSDIRDVHFDHKFDVVLNLADGAIGYLEDDVENLKIFDVISKSLKPGGKHVMDICNADYARLHFPLNTWDSGENACSLSRFEWKKDTRRMIYGGVDITYGKMAQKPEILFGDSIRLYAIQELTSILLERNMQMLDVFSDFEGHAAGKNHLQQLVFSEKL